MFFRILMSKKSSIFYFFYSKPGTCVFFYKFFYIKKNLKIRFFKGRSKGKWFFNNKKNVLKKHVKNMWKKMCFLKITYFYAEKIKMWKKVILLSKFQAKFRVSLQEMVISHIACRLLLCYPARSANNSWV